MKGQFKSNSRFGSLVEEVKKDEKNNKKTDVKKDEKNNKKIEVKKDENKKDDVKKDENVKKEQVKNDNNSFKNDNNSFKNDNNSFKNDNNSSFRNEGNSFKNNRSYKDRCLAEYAAREQKLIKEEKERIEAENQKKLEITNFPELVSTFVLPKIDNIPSISFLEKVTTINTVKEEDNIDKEKFDFNNLKPGWSMLKRNPVTNQTIIKSKVIISEKEESVLSEVDVAYNILYSLVDLHERRKEKYIESWGEDEYEKMFMFPNYDYEYFDKLDEKYEKEMEKLEENEYYEEYNDYYEE